MRPAKARALTLQAEILGFRLNPVAPLGTRGLPRGSFQGPLKGPFRVPFIEPHGPLRGPFQEFHSTLKRQVAPRPKLLATPVETEARVSLDSWVSEFLFVTLPR